MQPLIFAAVDADAKLTGLSGSWRFPTGANLPVLLPVLPTLAGMGASRQITKAPFAHCQCVVFSASPPLTVKHWEFLTLKS